MSQRIVVKDTHSGIEKTVSSRKEVITFMVLQTQCLLLQSRLTSKEIMQLEALECASGTLLLLDRFEVTSQNGA